MVKDGWIYCPVCKHKTHTKIYDNTRAEHFPLYCRFCRREYMIDIKDGDIRPAKVEVELDQD